MFELSTKFYHHHLQMNTLIKFAFTWINLELLEVPFYCSQIKNDECLKRNLIINF